MGYTPPLEIDVGSAAINRGTTFQYNRTIVDKANPANESGKITSVEIWAQQNMSNCEVATFFVVSGDNLSTRDTHTIGSVTAGSKQTFSGLDITVEAGDYIGIYFTAGRIEKDYAGGVGLWDIIGDYIPCTNTTFSYNTDNVISLYGIGTSGAGELTIGDSLSIAGSKTISVDKALAEAFDIADSLIENVTKQLSEAFSIVDGWVAGISLAETLSVTDSLVKTASFAKTEAFSIVDGWVARIGLTEAFTIIDSLTSSVSLAKAEVFSITDSWAGRIRLSESFQIVDSFAKTISYYFAEAFGIADSYRKSINWIEEVKVAVGWTEESKNVIVWDEESKNVIVWNEETKI